MGYTLPKTNIATENRWLEDDPFLLGVSAYFQSWSVKFPGFSGKKKLRTY